MVAHVTGDAVDAVLDAFAGGRLPSPDPRHALIHAYFVHPDSAARAAHLGVLVDTQPAWYYKDADALAGLGRERLAHFIGLRTLREVKRRRRDQHRPHVRPRSRRGAESVQSFPDHTPRRRTQSGNVSGGEAVSREEALRMMTSAHALQLRREDAGSIEVGKVADFVVLDTDIMTPARTALRAIQPEMTVIGGRVAYERTARR